MKKYIVFFAFLFLFMILCMATCPDKPAHHGAIVAKYGQVDKDANGLERFGGAIEGKFLSLALDSRLDVQDCIVLSLGQIDGNKIISVGFLNHVFVFGKKKIDEALKN